MTTDTTNHLDDMPPDIQAAAEAAYLQLNNASNSENVHEIANAILSERQRCVDICEYVVKNIRNSFENRRRFDIYDLDQALKSGARIVKEAITGEDKGSWYKDGVSTGRGLADDARAPARGAESE